MTSNISLSHQPGFGRYYLEDGTVSMSEPRIENSGIVQGQGPLIRPEEVGTKPRKCILKVHKGPKGPKILVRNLKWLKAHLCTSAVDRRSP